MRMNTNPVPMFAAKAEARVNVVFAANAQNIAHYNKRQQAAIVNGGGPASPEFEEAAQIEGMSVANYALVVLGKPDEMMQAENKRRRIVVAIRAATTIQQITDILAAEGLTDANSGDARPIV